ncbi:MAG: hypothetical protein VYC39_07400 [Myxococcota bacterium]|nr:hypothetical protein [Myxococcota bacterium]
MRLEHLGYRFCGLVLFLLLVLTVLIANDSNQIRRLIQNTGLLACVLLACATFVSPMQNLLPHKINAANASSLRRCLGVSATVVALVHLSVIFFSNYVSNVVVLITEPQFRNGSGAMLVLFILSLSSFQKPRTFLRITKWKSLHRLLYIALPITLLHWVSSPGYSSLDKWISVLLIFAIIGLRILSFGKAKLNAFTSS